MSICEQYYPEEPTKPTVKTESIPGPESQKQLKELGEVLTQDQHIFWLIMRNL